MVEEEDNFFVLFWVEIQSIPTVYNAVRDWIIKQCENIPLHSSRRVIEKIATNIYTDDEEYLEEGDQDREDECRKPHHSCKRKLS